MGSPMVFQTAPPQPASKARMTCSPQLAGGPEASQKGLGHRMPAKLVVRSAMMRSRSARCVQPSPTRGALAVGHRVHHFAAAVDAIAAGVIFRIAGAAGRRGRPRSSRRRSRRAAWRSRRDCPSAGITMSHATANSRPGSARHAAAAGIGLAQSRLARIRRPRRGRLARRSRPAAPASGTARLPPWSGRTRTRRPASRVSPRR